MCLLWLIWKHSLLLYHWPWRVLGSPHYWEDGQEFLSSNTQSFDERCVNVHCHGEGWCVALGWFSKSNELVELKCHNLIHLWLIAFLIIIWTFSMRNFQILSRNIEKITSFFFRLCDIKLHLYSQRLIFAIGIRVLFPIIAHNVGYILEFVYAITSLKYHKRKQNVSSSKLGMLKC